MLQSPICKVAGMLPLSCSVLLLTETFMHAQRLTTTGLTVLGASENYQSTNNIIKINTLKQQLTLQFNQ